MSAADGIRRKERARQLVQAYYDQLAVGCGSQSCTNEYCRSSSRFRALPQSELPKVAVDLAKRKATLCKTADTGVDGRLRSPQPTLPGPSRSEAMNTQADENVAVQSEPQLEYAGGENSDVTGTAASTADAQTVDDVTDRADAEITTVPVEESSACASTMDVVDGCSSIVLEETVGEYKDLQSAAATAASMAMDVLEGGDQADEAVPAVAGPFLPAVEPLELDEVLTLVTVVEESGEPDMLHERFRQVFSSWEALSMSFQAKPSSLPSSPMTQGETSHQPMDVVEARDSAPSGPVVRLDIDRLREGYSCVARADADAAVTPVIADSLLELFVSVDSSLKASAEHQSGFDPQYLLNLAVLVLEMPWLQDPLFLESVVSKVLHFCSRLPKCYRMCLATHFASYSTESLEALVTAVRQFLAFHLVMEDVEDGELVPDEATMDAIVTMEILYAASVLGCRASGRPLEAEIGKWFRNWPRTLTQCLVLMDDEEKQSQVNPRLKSIMPELKKRHLWCTLPLVPFSSFISEPLNSALDLQQDYINFQYYTYNFSVMRYPFLVSPEVKARLLVMDFRIRQRVERRTIVQVGNMLVVSPFLKIQVRRDNIIQDTLTRLEIAAADDPLSFQKQLYIEFEGEQGVDEGGVQKEFFQILVEQLFNADFGMFTYDEDTRLFWFSPMPFDNEANLALIGMLLGLALYNNVILDVHFPIVVYRKLMGVDGRFEDLKESHPTIANGLQQMLDHEEDGFEETFSCTFCVGYQSVFGETLSHDLKEDGASHPVTKENRQEYVDLYSNFILNKMIYSQFEAFKKGFTTVTHKSNLSDWFLPDELELLVCGWKDLDFEAMEAATEYDGGFEIDTPIIRDFWDIVHNFSEQQKRQLLAFCTGSDRVPVGGLKQLHFVIVRNGPDSERLPTAHTCFNTLLLPHYQSRDALEERLLKAISHAKGFGMV